MRLPEHRADVTDLEHQPLQRGVAIAKVLRHQLARFGRQVDQDRARFEQRNGAVVRAIGIDDRGNLVVRTDGQKFRRELVAGTDVDRVNPIRQRALLQHNVYLVPVRRGPGIKVDHGEGGPQWTKGPPL